MIEVILQTVQMALVSTHRVVLLKEKDGERYLPIWIGPCEAQSIAIALSQIETPRPLTHDLIVDLMDRIGVRLSYIYIDMLKDNTFHAKLVTEHNGEEQMIDSRSSDAVAIAVRVGARIFVDEDVMAEASVIPEHTADTEETPESEEDEENLGVFRDFLKSLDEDDPHPNEG